jgi:hypothetical protein
VLAVARRARLLTQFHRLFALGELWAESGTLHVHLIACGDVLDSEVARVGGRRLLPVLGRLDLLSQLKPVSIMLEDRLKRGTAARRSDEGERASSAGASAVGAGWQGLAK